MNENERGRVKFMLLGENVSGWRGWVRMCYVGEVGRGLVMLGGNSIVWVILSEFGKDLVRFGEVW